MKDENFISAVVYISGNSNVFAEFFRGITNVLHDNFENCEIVCVNDNAEKDNVNFVKQVATEFSGVVISIVHMSYYQGIECAMRAGVDCSIGDFVFEFDKPVFDYPIETIMQTYYRILDGFDIVNASSLSTQSLGSALLYSIYNRYSGLPTKLKPESFRVLTRRAINRVRSVGKYTVARSLLYANCGLKSDTLFYEPLSRNVAFYAKPEKATKQREEIVFDSIILYTNLLFKGVVFIAATAIAAVICLIIYTCYANLNNVNISKWMIVSLIVPTLFILILAFLVVVIKYLHLLTKLIYRQQPYIVETIEKLSSERRTKEC